MPLETLGWADCLRNYTEPVWAVRHSDLERYSDESVYRSVCPRDDCEGLLLVARNSITGELVADDHCTLCAQRVKYLDIARMRRELR